MITIQNPCHCSKEIIALVCSRANPTTGGKVNLPSNRSCGRKCGKPLSCRNHFCQELCHEGECIPCTVTDLARCWCGKEMRTIACGEGDAKECKILMADGEESWTGKFGCHNSCERFVFLPFSVNCGNKSYISDPSTVVFTNAQSRAIRRHSKPPSALILLQSLLAVRAANTPFLMQPLHPISVTARSSFEQPVLIRFRRVCLYVRNRLTGVRIPAARHVIRVHVPRVRSHLSGPVVAVQQRGRPPAVPRRQKQSQRLSCAISLVVPCARVVIINVLVYAVRLRTF